MNERIDFPVRNPEHSACRYGRGLLLEHPDSRDRIALNRVAAFVWERADGSASVDHIHADIVETFAVDADAAWRDLRRFLDEALRVGLLSRTIRRSA